MTFLVTLGVILLSQQIAVEQVDPIDAPSIAQAIEQLSKRGDAEMSDPIGAPDGDGGKDVQQLSRPDTTLELTRVEGMDRCSAELLSDKDADFCARRIETRSGDFSPRPAPSLTAEQVLVGEKYASVAGVGVANASRDATRRELSPEDQDLQALASLTLPSTTPPPAAKEEPQAGLPAATEALIEAIVNQLSQPGGN
ncbi:MAG: hypothetical protein VX512_08290 [Pseudomonadota bacterium]|nr:hypothetical protein [Pseudomonadota bacterium]|tara:strand:- start:745 stop:1335 length:591 start_codon:yes stop_codon:yes gene_type:complete